MSLDFNSMLAIAFGAWASVVAWGVKAMLGRLDTIASKLDKESAKLNEYIVTTETRLAVIEDRIDNN